MRAVVAGANTELVGKYVQDMTGALFEPGAYQALAILDDDDTFCGGIIFSEYNGFNCQLSSAVETPMAWRDGVLNAMFAYIFVQLGCVRCTSIVKKSNKRARAILEGLGFVLEGRIRRGFDGVRDGLVYGMLREECEYIQEVGGGESVPAPEDFEEDEPVEPEHVGAVETQPATGEFW